MIADLSLEQRITLEVERCYECGRYWALEHNFSGSCPKCAQDKKDEESIIIIQQDKTIAALKGQITKLKKAL